MKNVAITVFILLLACGSFGEDATQVVDWGVSLHRRTDHVPNYELAKFDNLGAFGVLQSVTFRLVSGVGVFDKSCFCFIYTPPAPECVPVSTDGVYTISARAVWSIDRTRTGVREFSIRILRDGVWSVLAEDVEPKLGRLPKEQIMQTVTMTDALLAGDCIGSLAFFRSRTRRLNFGVTSLLVVRQ